MQEQATEEPRNSNSNADPNAISFLELLRPVRDLAANWNVDVVSSLSDYLNELGMDQSVVHEISSLRVDFKQAALLVESSTSIYSRKVDYLYTLAFATADMIYEARGKKPLSRKTEGNDDDDSEDNARAAPHWEDMEFLLLDDLLDRQQAEPGSISLAPRDRSDRQHETRVRDAARITPVPLHLLPNGPQTSCTNTAAHAANVTGLRFPQATVDSSTGALILDGIGLNWTAMPSENGTALAISNDVPSSSRSLGLQPLLELPSDDHSDDEDNTATNIVCSPEDNRESVTNAAATGKDISQDGASSAHTPDFNPLTLPAFDDPFAPLDMYDKTSIPHRPVQRGKTWVLPQCSEMSANDPIPDLVSHSEISFESLSESILGPILSEIAPGTNRFIFTSFLKTQFRSRMRSLDIARRKRGRVDSERGKNACYVGETLDTERLVSDANESSLGSDRDLDDPFTFEDDNLDDEEEKHGDRPKQLPEVSSSETHVERIAATYEEACRKYLRESSTLWREHAAESNLVRRVSDWRFRIEPLLEAEEQRPSFDIKVYTKEILAAFRENSRESRSCVSDMATLFRTSEPFEVCRKFLATLQLANSYAVEILDAPCSSEQNQELIPQLKLLQPDPESCDTPSSPGPGRRRVLRERHAASPNSACELHSPVRKGQTSSKRLRSISTPENIAKIHRKLRTDS